MSLDEWEAEAKKWITSDEVHSSIPTDIRDGFLTLIAAHRKLVEMVEGCENPFKDKAYLYSMIGQPSNTEEALDSLVDVVKKIRLKARQTLEEVDRIMSE